MQFSVQNRLSLIIGLAVSFIIAELAVGFSTHSLALVADAFHYIGDVLSFAVALWADKLSVPSRTDEAITSESSTASSDTSSEHPQGRDRQNLHILPTLAAFFNSVFLLALGLGIFLQGIERFVHLEQISNPRLILMMGSVGLCLNIISAMILREHGHAHHHHGHGHHEHVHQDHYPHSHHGNCGQENNLHDGVVTDTSLPSTPQDVESQQHAHASGTALSMRAVFLHVAADAINNLAVIVAAVVIWKVPPKVPGSGQHGGRLESKYYADPACTVFIALLIMLGSAPLVVKSGKELIGWNGKDGEIVEVEAVEPSISTQSIDSQGAGVGRRVNDERKRDFEENWKLELKHMSGSTNSVT